MDFRWHRSRLFWIGFAGFLCLLWSWIGYLQKSVDVCWVTERAEYCVGWGGWGQVAFVINKREFYTSLEGSQELGFYSSVGMLEPDDEPELFAPALSLDGDRVGVFVGHWLVVTIYTAFWIVAVVSWQRRKKRLTRGLIPEHLTTIS